MGLECDRCGAEVTPQTYLYMVGESVGHYPVGCPACLTDFTEQREALEFLRAQGWLVRREDGGGYTIQDRRN